jgi:hypothetical protein
VHEPQERCDCADASKLVPSFTCAGSHYNYVVFLFAGNIYTIYTDNDYRYNYGWILPVYNYLAFKVRTCNDAHVLLSSSVDLTATVSYEVVLGGYDNLYSDIRRGPQGAILSQAYTPNIMNCNELLPVWIQWENQILEVGVGSLGAHTILRLDAPEVSSIQSASVTSWYSASGEYQFLESQGNYLLHYSMRYFNVHLLQCDRTRIEIFRSC